MSRTWPRKLYQDTYLNRGSFGLLQTHDDQAVVFHSDAFEHAFYTSSDWRCHPERKDVLRPGSIERIHWIALLISGQIQILPASKFQQNWKVVAHPIESMLFTKPQMATHMWFGLSHVATEAGSFVQPTR